MQNKEEEKRIREDFKNQFKNKILRISNHTPEAFDLIDDLQSFISQEIEKAYQRGKEEGLGEQLSQTKSITTKYEIPSIILEEFKNKTRLQTLEKMEREINLIPSTPFEFDPSVASEINQFKEEFLQTINKMKE